MRQAWIKPDMIIVNEICWNATARHAKIILPVTTTLERADTHEYFQLSRLSR
ncbi:molybdopterin-dependent oxidoreductase [Lentibacter algarum]|nr:molybdopterin-dependent oxidoreductase [Lentibacter algarum]